MTSISHVRLGSFHSTNPVYVQELLLFPEVSINRIFKVMKNDYLVQGCHSETASVQGQNTMKHMLLFFRNTKWTAVNRVLQKAK